MVNSLNLWCDFGPPFLFYPRFPFLLKRKKPENYRLQFSFILILEREFGAWKLRRLFFLIFVPISLSRSFFRSRSLFPPFEKRRGERKGKEGKNKKIKKKGMNKMKLCIEGIPEDVQQIVGQMVKEKREKLKITVYPIPLQNDGIRRYYVVVEMKKRDEVSL